MLKQKPNREPDLTIRDIRIDPDTLTIYYKLYYDKSIDNEVDWIIPQNTTFEPPADFKDGTSWAVWTEDISPTRKKDYDWVYLESMSEHNGAALTPLGRKIKNKRVKVQIEKVETELTNLKALFDGF